MLKKAVSVMLCLITVFCLFPISVRGATARYIVSSETAPMLDKPSLLANRVFMLYKGTYVDATEESNGFLKVTANSVGITGWIHSSLLDFQGSTPFNPQQITGIRIFKMPDKLSYIQDEEAFDPEGLVVSGVLADSSEIFLTGYNVFAPLLDTPGGKTVYITYKPPGATLVSFSASFKINVTKIPVSTLSIETMPQRDVSSYIEGHELDLTGLSLRLKYTDGRADRLFTLEEILSSKDFIIMGCHSENHGKRLLTGVHKIHIYYKYSEVSCTLTVTARAKVLTDFRIAAPPKSLTVYEKAIPDLEGLVLEAAYDNGLTEEISLSRCKTTCHPESFILGSGNMMTIEFGGKKVELDFTLALDEKTGIVLRGLLNLTFILGEPIDLSALEVYYVFRSGAEQKAESFTRSKIDMRKTGTQTVLVTCDNFYASFPVNITPYYRRGDVTGDGVLSAMDARLALRGSVGLTHLTGKPFTAADADKNGKLTAADARLILRAAVGLEDFLKGLGEA